MKADRRSIRLFLVLIPTNVVVILATVFMSMYLDSWLVLLPCLPVLLVLDTFLLYSKDNSARPVEHAQVTKREGRLSYYVVAGIFLFGTLFGILKVVEGDLPKASLLGLLVPFALGLYWLRAAHRRKAEIRSRIGE